eukprot:TRINITY_DN18943_c0_g1_i1.p2 TRINITY_DN18943_c0_g1~~TRINITY_DN18943_c0_g1_i1.p2  ORF type:complete len:119 (+),score=12.33 TRINITY_DN18943_c0_g1_i1:256-612(+)
MHSSDCTSNLITESSPGIGNSGLYVVKKGRCVVRDINNYNTIAYLTSGDVFGESELLGSKGYDCYGDIIAETKEAKLWYIAYGNVKKLPSYDYARLKENCIKNYTRMHQLLANHIGVS